MKTFAVIEWYVEDLQIFHDDWDDEKCLQWWKENEKWFVDALIEAGNNILANST